MIEPNIAAPEMKLMIEVTQNTFIRNRPSGRIGSEACASAQRKAARAMMATSARPMISGLAQAKLRPPRLVASVTDASVIDSVAAPSQSILCCTRRPVGLNEIAKPVSAAAPMGILM